jgi:hypothetical protein
MYLRVAGKGCERWSRAGKYEANRDHQGSERKNSERRESVPDVPALEKRTYMTYGKRMGHVNGMAHKKKKKVSMAAMERVWARTASVWSLRFAGTFIGAHRMLYTHQYRVEGGGRT